MLLILLILLLSVFAPSSVFAQTTLTNTVSVVPSIVHVDLQTDKPEVPIVYKNTTNQTIELSLSASDFTELEDGYKLSYLEEKNAQNYKYALSSWMNFDNPNVVLNPQESATINVFINKDKLTPGGHYGAVLAKMTNQSSSGNIQVIGTLSSLIFVRTNTGRELDAARIERLAPERDWIDNPTSFVLRFHNTGDTDLIPYGLITVKDMLGRTVARGIVNDNSLDALPESIRRYDIALRPTESFLIPGMYTASLSLHFGKTNKRLQATTPYFSQGSIPLIPIGIGMTIALFVAFRLARRKKKIS